MRRRPSDETGRRGTEVLTAALLAGVVGLLCEAAVLATVTSPLLPLGAFAIVLSGPPIGLVLGTTARRMAPGSGTATVGAWLVWALPVAVFLPGLGSETDWTTVLILTLL